VPYLTTLAPAIYELFGVRDHYDYLAATLGEDPSPLIEAGTSSDDWLRGVSDAFSLVCELPYYTSPTLADTSPAGRSRRDAVLAGVARARAVHAECAAGYAAITRTVPDHRLTRAVLDYLAKAPKRLAAEETHARGPDYAREATRAEVLDATTCRVFYHVLTLGEVHRLAGLAGDGATAARLRERVATLTTEVERESALTVLPLRPLVQMQLGAGVLAMVDATGPGDG